MVSLSRFSRVLLLSLAWPTGMLTGARGASAQSPVPDTPALKRMIFDLILYGVEH